jgi:hypothetical protein
MRELLEVLKSDPPSFDTFNFEALSILAYAIGDWGRGY